MKVTDFKRKKQRCQKISMLTCYDYPSAKIAAQSTLDCVLVGDSVAMTVHGFETTVMATIDMMCLHTAAVARGAQPLLVVSDLPFLSYQASRSITIHNVQRLMQAGAQAIKLEGGDDTTCQTISYLVKAGIAIIGHIGLTPQAVHQLGGYTIQGKSEPQAQRLLEQAQALEHAGCCALVLECIPATLAHTITQALTIPTIGIGAGNHTDGQVLVWHDMLGMQDDFKPKFLKQFAHSKSFTLQAINQYAQAVRNASFPAAEHTY